jgi:hypothetical protein
MPIGSNAQFAPTSDPQSVSLLDVYGGSLNARSWSHPIYQATASDPMRTGTSHAGTWQFRVPTDAVAALPTDGDRHIHVIDPTKQYVDECWVAVKQASGNWWCEYHVRNNLRGPGVGENGVRAYGGSAIGGLIRLSEAQANEIRHALAFAMPRAKMAHGPVWPAITEDGGATYGGALHMGQLVAIPRTVNLSSLGLSPGGMMLARALRDYGAYLVDASSNFAFFAEPTAEHLLAGARADIGKIREQLRVVTNNSATSVGGGGTPIAPLAPGFTG